jgi:hypothetical protein
MVEGSPWNVNSSSIGTGISYLYRTCRSIVMSTETATGLCPEMYTHADSIYLRLFTLSPKSHHVNLSIWRSATFVYLLLLYYHIRHIGLLCSNERASSSLIKMKTEPVSNFVPKCKINGNRWCTNHRYNTRRIQIIISLYVIFPIPMI